MQHEDLMQSPYCPVIPEEGTFSVNALKLETLSTQISASKFQNLSQISLKICGDWKNRGVWVKHSLKIWKLTQNFDFLC